MKKTTLIFAAILTLAGVATAILIAWLNMTFDPKRSRANQERIGSAYILFHRDTGRFAPSLEALVKAGYLPARGAFYAEPPGILHSDISYLESPYRVFEIQGKKVSSLNVIGRRIGGKDAGQWDFDPVVNVIIRDACNGDNR